MQGRGLRVANIMEVRLRILVVTQGCVGLGLQCLFVNAPRVACQLLEKYHHGSGRQSNIKVSCP